MVGLVAALDVVGAGAGAGELPLPPPEAHLPTGGEMPEESLLMSDPGLGKSRSLPSLVEQPFPTFATNMAGRLLRALVFLLELPEMLTVAQFMYISRLPTLLNQVQAKRASPEGVSLGILKS